MTHQSVEGSAAAVPADLVRLSCGIEDPRDLADDLRRAGRLGRALLLGLGQRQQRARLTLRLAITQGGRALPGDQLRAVDALQRVRDAARVHDRAAADLERAAATIE